MDGVAMGGDSNGSGMSDPGEGGATNTANVMQGGGTKPKKGTYDTSVGNKGGFWNDANSRPLGDTTGIQDKAKWNVKM